MRNPDVHFSPAPHRVVEEMLRIADVNVNDVVYDLGCGDGRIVIAAAQKCGARGVGVDLDESLLAESLLRAQEAGVEERVEFLRQDFFASDLRAASVITLYLLDSLNVRLRPKILSECRPGTRVVTYSFEMGEWEPDNYVPIAANGVLLWVVPANLKGTWSGEEGGVSEVTIQQKFQQVSGTVVLNGEVCPIKNGKVNGTDFVLAFESARMSSCREIRGRVHADRMEGCIVDGDLMQGWAARRNMPNAK